MRIPLDRVRVRVTRRGELVASTGAAVFAATADARSDPDAWFGRDARVFEVPRTAATSRIRIDDRVETADAVFAVRDVETMRFAVRLTAERAA